MNNRECAYFKRTESFTTDEMWAIDNLAWMVIRSKQNLGTRMKDHAGIVLKILASKNHRFSNEHHQEI